MSLILIIAYFLTHLLLQTLCLWLGAKWLKSSRCSWWQAARVEAVLVVLNLCVLPVFYWLTTWAQRQGISILLLVMTLSILGDLAMIYVIFRRMFELTPKRAGLLCGIFLLNMVPGAIANEWGFRPYLFEAFHVPSNSMSPTVCGWHRTGACPRCQGTLILSAPQPRDREFNSPGSPVEGICVQCRKSSEIPYPAGPIHACDRIIVNKFYQPQRWDIILFHSPFAPESTEIKRLVGLPGEKVYIQDGAVWINDVKISVPAGLQGLEYLTQPDLLEKFGPPDLPWQLGPDEYCVLGDFSARSRDSRYWGAVPKSHIVGVVSTCYWPLSRWRVFR